MFIQWGIRPKNNANLVKLFLQCKWLIDFVKRRGRPMCLPNSGFAFCFWKNLLCILQENSNFAIG